MHDLQLVPNHRRTTIDVGIPLLENTDSASDVALIVGRLLSDIETLDCRASHADILQALAITTAVRLAMADAAARPGVDVPMRLLDVEVGEQRKAAARPA